MEKFFCKHTCISPVILKLRIQIFKNILIPTFLSYFFQLLLFFVNLFSSICHKRCFVIFSLLAAELLLKKKLSKISYSILSWFPNWKKNLSLSDDSQSSIIRKITMFSCFFYFIFLGLWDISNLCMGEKKMFLFLCTLYMCM